MKRVLLIMTAALSLWTVVAAFAADSGPMISKMAKGEVAMVPEGMSGGELMFKMVAVNRTPVPAQFGPKDIQVFAAGKPVQLMSLAQLVAQARRAAGENGGSVSYESSATGGPTVSSNRSGQPNLDNFAGGDTMSGEVSSQRSRGGSENPAVKRQIATLRSAILRKVVIAPGALKGGEVVTRPIRPVPSGKQAFRVDIQFNGEKHEFTFAAPPAH